jgi:serine/threonine protein phosphatase PrpC
MSESNLIVSIAAITHSGPVRQANEDHIAVGKWSSAADMEEPYCTSSPITHPLLLAVCDGMGGHRGGATASAFAAEQWIQSHDRSDSKFDVGDVGNAINTKIYEMSFADPDLQWMGTTVAGLVIGGTDPIWFNIGDSSVILFTDWAMKLSQDDVPPGERSGVLTQALGGVATQRRIKPHSGQLHPDEGMTYLLCSDGLTDVLSLTEIEEALALSPADAARSMVAQVIERHGSDNVSIIIARVEAPEIKEEEVLGSQD